MRGVCRFRWCQYSLHDQFQATNLSQLTPKIPENLPIGSGINRLQPTLKLGSGNAIFALCMHLRVSYVVLPGGSDGNQRLQSSRKKGYRFLWCPVPGQNSSDILRVTLQSRALTVEVVRPCCEVILIL